MKTDAHKSAALHATIAFIAGILALILDGVLSKMTDNTIHLPSGYIVLTPIALAVLQYIAAYVHHVQTTGEVTPPLVVPAPTPPTTSATVLPPPPPLSRSVLPLLSTFSYNAPKGELKPGFEGFPDESTLHRFNSYAGGGVVNPSTCANEGCLLHTTDDLPVGDPQPPVLQSGERSLANVHTENLPEGTQFGREVGAEVVILPEGAEIIPNAARDVPKETLQFTNLTTMKTEPVDPFPTNNPKP